MHAVVGPRDQQHEDRQRIAGVHDLAQDLEARLVGPLHALDDESPAAATARSRRGGCARPPGSSCGARARPRRLRPSGGWSRARRGAPPSGSPRRRSAAPPPARAMSAATSSNGSSPVVPMASRTSSATAAKGTSIRTGEHSTRTIRAFGGSSPRNVADERGLADPHLADDRARHELPGAAAAAHRRVVGGVQIGFLGVAPDEIARARLRLRQPLFARQAAFERVEAHRRGHVGRRLRVELRGSARRPSGSRAARGDRRRRRPRSSRGVARPSTSAM